MQSLNHAPNRHLTERAVDDRKKSGHDRIKTKNGSEQDYDRAIT
jgi:hypothetical protein